MARSRWKGPYVSEHTLIKVRKARAQIKEQGFVNTSELIRANRNDTIIPEFVGLHFKVHNGKSYLPVNVNENMVGYKFGEFSPTKKPVKHPENKKEKKK